MKTWKEAIFRFKEKRRDIAVDNTLLENIVIYILDAIDEDKVDGATNSESIFEASILPKQKLGTKQLLHVLFLESGRITNEEGIIATEINAAFYVEGKQVASLRYRICPSKKYATKLKGSDIH
jgi:hypothetical protein